MRTTHTDNQTTCLAITNMVHKAVVHLDLTFKLPAEEIEEIQGREIEAELKMPTVPDNEDDEPERRGTTLLSMDPEKETALCKALVRISKDSVVVMFTLLHCWEELRKCDKWNGQEVPNFLADMEEKKSKRYKSAAIVRSTRRSRCKDEAKRKEKVVMSSRSSTTSFDVGVSAKLMANQYVMTNDPYNATKGMSQNSRMQK
ncbi:hypothetical protein Tco_0944760 [Tanacetum coccineum]